MEFDNGSAFNLSAEFLRVYSPAADSKIRSIEGEKVIENFFFHLYCSFYFSFIFLNLSRQIILNHRNFFSLSVGNN